MEEPKARAEKILRILKEEYKDAKVALRFSNPLELLIATILSAQCTDERVNAVTKSLFQKYRRPEDYLNVSLEELEHDIKPTGFYKNKARNIQRACRVLVEKFGSQVPKKMEELLSLPGVGRKTANIVLSNAYGIHEGIAVDTHVRRLAFRLGLTKERSPDKIEEDLMALFPKEDWLKVTDVLIFHGRRVCSAKKPACDICIVSRFCPSAFSFPHLKKAL
ncbi:endonuclease III [Candidatus Bathyarchaeota archaeon]|nr:endonuclease III [Candidatus Bathyarchaeota archaeon]MBS7628076.1 endonuclease III [Candidatus Bathyarchaeota archaeon]